MEISIFENQASVSLKTLDVADEYIDFEYLIDTGFTGNVIFTVNKSWDVFKILEISNINLLKKGNWIALANGRKVKTFSAELFLLINNDFFEIPILIIESESEDKIFQPPLLGMKFLEFMKSHLSLDFENNRFSLK